MVLKSSRTVVPCYQDLVSYVLGHDNYDPQKPVLIDSSDQKSSITLCDARIFVRMLVSGLHDYGLSTGDTVCVHMFNHIMYPILFLGIVGSGGRFTGSNPVYTAAELTHHFKSSQTQYIITEKAHLSVVKQAAVQSGIDLARIIIFGDQGAAAIPSHVSLAQLMIHGQKPWLTFDDAQTSKTTPAVLASTSGTTGLPKMAMKSHHSMVTENQGIEETNKKPYEVKRLLTIPFFHGFGAPLALVSALRSGHTTYVMRKFEQNAFLRAIQNYEITEAAMAPPLIVRLEALPQNERAALKNLRLVWSGGAPMTSEMQNHALEMFAHDARIVQVWGMTEGGIMATLHYPEADYSGAVGRLICTYEAKFVDDSGNEIHQPGVRGEIQVRSPINMLEYLGNPKATKDIYDKEGFMKTGDIAFFSEDGKIHIVDRMKELIKVRGWQVAPGELETRLLTHQDIIDAAVIGIPQPNKGTEIPRAYIVCRPETSVSVGCVKDYLLQTLSRYKVSDCEVRFRDSIPKSTTGKILKNILREEARLGA